MDETDQKGVRSQRQDSERCEEQPFLVVAQSSAHLGRAWFICWRAMRK